MLIRSSAIFTSYIFSKNFISPSFIYSPLLFFFFFTFLFFLLRVLAFRDEIVSKNKFSIFNLSVTLFFLFLKWKKKKRKLFLFRLILRVDAHARFSIFSREIGIPACYNRTLFTSLSFPLNYYRYLQRK